MIIAGPPPLVCMVLRTRITDSNATTNNGGVFIPAGAAQLTVRNCTFANARAGERGGFMHVVGGSVTIDQGTKILYTNATTHGGAFSVIGGTIQLHDVAMRNLYAVEYGGSFHVSGAATVHVTKSSITNSYAEVFGGAFHVTGGSVRMMKSTITSTAVGNRERVIGRGGSFSIEGGSTTVESSIITNSTSYGQHGGFVRIIDGNFEVMGGSEIINCSTGNYGGVAMSMGGILKFTNSSIVNGTSGETGGCWSMWGGGEIY
eukprot:7385260-Prymnesium_polylepis.1